MKFFRRCLPVLSLAGLLFLALSGTAHADVNDFTITDFSSQEALTRADPQGELHVEETIWVNFTDNNHGIERAIPERYKGNNLNFHLDAVSSDTGAPVQVSKRHENGYLVLRIGEPNSTVTGSQEYTINYTLRNVISFYSDHDELYWNVNGTQWDQPVDKVAVVLSLPDGAQLASQRPVCFAGSYGSQNEQCEIRTANGEVRTSASGLGPNQTLTYAVGFQKGFFVAPTFWNKLTDHLWAILSLTVPPLIGLIVGLIWWYKRGRDAQGRGTIIPEYLPPDALSPLEAGTVADFKVDDRDLTATIIDLARRGYLKIIETKTERKIFGDKLNYTVELISADTAELNEFETSLIRGMFDNFEPGEKLHIGTYNADLGKTAAALRKSVTKKLTLEGYFKTDPARLTFSWTSVWVIVWVGVILLGQLHNLTLWPLVAGAAAGVIILGIFIHLLPARTVMGVAVREHLLGLKMYMETAEKDRMEKLEGPDAAYVAKGDEPAHTVEFFEKLLPYAIVLGVETSWAAQFKDVYTNPPDWYIGSNLTAFNAGYLAGALTSGITPAMNHSFTAPSSSSSSGFGGGGFAGGGGGGGGGGGW